MATFISSCEYFSTESQLLRQVNGIYGEDTNCTYVAPGEVPSTAKDKPILMVVGDSFSVDDKFCRLNNVKKDGKGFILKPINCTANWKNVSDSKLTYNQIDPFEIRVEAINRDVVKFKEIGKEPMTVYRCGSKSIN